MYLGETKLVWDSILKPWVGHPPKPLEPFLDPPAGKKNKILDHFGPLLTLVWLCRGAKPSLEYTKPKYTHWGAYATNMGD